MIGQLYHCLQHRKLFDGDTAFPAELSAAAWHVGIVRCLLPCAGPHAITRSGTLFDQPSLMIDKRSVLYFEVSDHLPGVNRPGMVRVFRVSGASGTLGVRSWRWA